MARRKPRFDPDTTLAAYWDPKEDDLMMHWPTRKADGHLLHGVFSYAPKSRGSEASLLDELTRRGFDVKTIRFTVQLKERPREPHVTAVEACPHGCVGACSLCESGRADANNQRKESK